MADSTFRPKIWTPGDWNAFFGFGTNILVNMLTLTALLRFVLKMPDSLVFGRILPAVGLMLLSFVIAAGQQLAPVSALLLGSVLGTAFLAFGIMVEPKLVSTGKAIAERMLRLSVKRVAS